MGLVQKIFYVHLPSAMIFMVSSVICGVASAVFLIGGRNPGADRTALAAAELAIVFGLITLVTGPLWGRKAWGVWWVWDARLTSTLIMFLVFAGYLALRAFVEEPERRALWSSVAGIFGAINYPIVYMSVRWWRTIHQLQSSPSTLDPNYTLSLRLNAFAFLFLLIYFIRRRYVAAMTERVAEQTLQAAVLGGASRAS